MARKSEDLLMMVLWSREMTGMAYARSGFLPKGAVCRGTKRAASEGLCEQAGGGS